MLTLSRLWLLIVFLVLVTIFSGSEQPYSTLHTGSLAMTHIHESALLDTLAFQMLNTKPATIKGLTQAHQVPSLNQN